MKKCLKNTSVQKCYEKVLKHFRVKKCLKNEKSVLKDNSVKKCKTNCVKNNRVKKYTPELWAEIVPLKSIFFFFEIRNLLTISAINYGYSIMSFPLFFVVKFRHRPFQNFVIEFLLPFISGKFTTSIFRHQRKFIILTLK